MVPGLLWGWLVLTDGIGFDRDLGVAGRAMVRTEDGSIVQKLLKIDRPSKYA